MKHLRSFTYWLSISLAYVMSESLDLHPGTTSGKTSPMKIVVGGYNKQGKINVLEFNPSTHTFNKLSESPTDSAGKNPSFITFSPDGRYLFATNEVLNFGGLEQTGSVNSFEIQSDGGIRNISTGLTGADPVSLALSPNGQNLIVAEYTGGSWSRFSVNNRGEFKTPKPIQSNTYHGSGPIIERQDKSYIHQVLYNKAGDLVFFVDLGGDSVYVHHVNRLTGEVGNMAHEIKVPPGVGPRHLTMVEKNKEYDIYLISELSNQIFTIQLTYTHKTIKSIIRQQLSTLPPGIANTKTFGAGEVMVSGDGRFVYGSNRQTDFSKPTSDNSIVIFERDLQTGLLVEKLDSSSPAWVPITIGGKTPRHFSFSNDLDQSFMVVGCQQSNTLVIYHRDSKTGRLKLLSSTAIAAPAVQLFLPQQHQNY